MISVIVSIGDQNNYDSILLPSLSNTNEFLKRLNFPELDIIPLQGKNTICETYNHGLRQAKYRIKAFIHEDVDMLDPSWVLKIIKCFAEYPDTELPVPDIPEFLNIFSGIIKNPKFILYLYDCNLTILLGS